MVKTLEQTCHKVTHSNNKLEHETGSNAIIIREIWVKNHIEKIPYAHLNSLFKTWKHQMWTEI